MSNDSILKENNTMLKQILEKLNALEKTVINIKINR